jgi:hypothetical protein
MISVDQPQHTITYTGSAPTAGLVAQLLRESGLDVSYEPPEERRGMEWLAEGVTVYYLCKAGDSAVRAAVQHVRDRLGARGTITADTDDDESDDRPKHEG